MTKNKWIYWIKLLVSLILLVIVYRKVNNHDAVLAAFQATPWWHLAIFSFLIIPNYFLQFLKWRFLLRRRFHDVENKAVFGSLLFGSTLGLITPGRLGELGRGLFFPNKDRMAITGLNVLDKFANQLLVFTLGGISLVVINYRIEFLKGSSYWLVLIAGCLLLISIWSLVLQPALLSKVARRLLAGFSWRKKLLPLVNGFDSLRTGDGLVVMGYTALIYSLIVCQYHLLLHSFNGITLWQSCVAVMAMLFIKTLLPISFGDLGTREMLAIFFYGIFHVSEAAVFNVSLLIFFINVLLPALVGLYYVFQVRDLPGSSPEEDPDIIASENP